MGQIGSVLRRSKRRRQNAQPSPSLLLELPVDIILYLCREHLRPKSALALSLTCKSLLAVVSCHTEIRLSSADREEFLLLLEKDVGHERYYCHSCSVLHRFIPYPEPPALPSSTRLKLDLGSCRRRNLVFLSGSCVIIGYHHIRLAMNRHFYGPPNGLPLAKFQVKTTSLPLYPPWRERWSARIFQNELFLSTTRTLSGIDKTDQELRNAVDQNYYRICNHVDTAKHTTQPINALHLGSPSTDFFIPSRDTVQSCDKCLTDYDTTIERRRVKIRDGKRKRVKGYWVITITSYHRLGDGRSPRDPKWRAFAAYGYLAPYGIIRDMIRYPPGSVRQIWKETES